MSATAGVLGRSWVNDGDVSLLEHVRAGDTEAYAELWRRHLPAAYRVAHRYRGRASAEDIVGEASLRVYDLIQAGKGPTSNFRSYFLTAVKSVAVDLGRSELRVVPSEPEDLEFASAAEQPYNAALRVDQELVRTAFRRLPDRDQKVLWHTEVEGRTPAMVSTSMGMTPNAVSAAAMRAREALRARYLDAHSDRAVERAKSDECRWVLGQMGRYVRGKLPARQRLRVDTHLQECRHAQVLARELVEINRGLPALIVPLVFVAGSQSAAAWAAAGLAAGGTVEAPAPSGMPDATTLVLGGAGAGATGLVAKAAAVVATGALGAGFVASPSGGLDAFTVDRGTTQAAAGPVAGGGGSGGSAGGGSAGSGSVGGGAAGGPAAPAAPLAAAPAAPAAPLAAEAEAPAPVAAGAAAPVAPLVVAAGAGAAMPILPAAATPNEPALGEEPKPSTPSTGASNSRPDRVSSSTTKPQAVVAAPRTRATTPRSTTPTPRPANQPQWTSTRENAKPSLRAQMRNHSGALVTYDTGGTRGGTVTVSINSGAIKVRGCNAAPGQSVSCTLNDGSGSLRLVPVGDASGNVTVTLTNGSGTATVSSTVTSTVRDRDRGEYGDNDRDRRDDDDRDKSRRRGWY